MKPEEVRLGQRTVEPYREEVFTGDSRVMDLASRALALAMQEMLDDARKSRVVEYNVLLSHFERIAQENGGNVPIAVVRDILTDALEAKI